jgi:hypothetical protein
MADPGTAVVLAGQDTRSEETLLRDHVRRIERSRQGTYAVHIHISKLHVRYLQPHYLRVATRAFDNLVANFEVMIYMMSNSDMILVCRETPIEDVDEPLYKVRALFSEDPLAMGEEGSLDDRFTTWYDLTLPSDFANFETLAEDLAEEAAEKQRRELSRADGRQAMTGEDLNPSNLADINRRLQSTPIADLIREQPAVLIVPDGQGEVIFREHYVSMGELHDRLAPDVNLFANMWLFLYLTETLDRLVLGVMSRLDFSTMSEAISLNLNISTVLSPGFQTFHDRVRDHSEKVVIELQTVDIFADMDSYFSARDWLRDAGYRVLIDGLSPLSLQFVDPGLFDADFVKIGWSPEFMGDVPKYRMIEMHDIVEHTGFDRVILSRVESDAAVKWGLEIGIQRYQGHYADRIVEAMVLKGIV